MQFAVYLHICLCTQVSDHYYEIKDIVYYIFQLHIVILHFNKYISFFIVTMIQCEVSAHLCSYPSGAETRGPGLCPYFIFWPEGESH